ncbi:MAG: Uncharacterized protein XD91_0555 [Clostridiales bacterium 38_11]|nr:MAG: Uncharacterized protein XD91_0555 [Clostridiales bacterium 38_11]HBH13010.1 3-keto-5-aminohexanoate cleavage protein [Clostridiales bacterium]
MKKTIITAALTGGIHTPGMSEYLPITPDQIIADALTAYRAGAAVVHIHARNPENGRPTSDIELFTKIAKGIKEQSDLVVCVTTGGGLGMTIEERLKPVTVLKPELASCNSGSINFVLAPAAKKLKPKYDWEIPYLESTEDLIFSNTFKGIRSYVETMYANDTIPEFEVYDIGMINNLAYFKEVGLFTKPIYLQFVMGILGGIPAEADNLTFMVKKAKQQLGDLFEWSVAAAGKNQFYMTSTALSMGGHVRVGLEDNVYLKPRVLAKNSGEQVAKIRQIIEAVGGEVATTDEAREILGLKGKSKVGY